jgi:hypothetical protein
MKIDIKLFDNEKESPEGFPLALQISHQGKRKRKNIAYCKGNHFIKDGKTISEKHPDYDVLMPVLMDLKLRSRKLVLLGWTDVEKVYSELFKADVAEVKFLDFATDLITEMKKTAAVFGKTDFKAQNKLLGNIKCYEAAVASFKVYGQNLNFESLNYDVLIRYKNFRSGEGNSKSTVHFYLRTLRSIYNKGIWKYKFTDNKPFAKVFEGLKIRSYDSKKKSIDRAALSKLELSTGNLAKQKYLDLFLLQFYFGGCDLVDVYYLMKTQIHKGRVTFERTKTDTGKRIDLKIHPKAQTILQKYECDGDWVFPWNKDKTRYETFRRNYREALIAIQTACKIEILPTGGNLGVKVARHTFATIAKNLMIEEDVIRELMGHERDDVDNYYKDKYPEAIRDKALFDIIG